MNNQAHIKPEINPEHPRIKNRTPDQQKYRDDLAQVLKANRQLGDVGRQAARVVLENESKSPEYISAKENIPEDLEKDILELEYVSHSEELEDLQIDRILEKSKGVSHQKIAKLLIEKGYWSAVTRNLRKFGGVDHKEIAELLIEKGYWRNVGANLRRFWGVDHKEIAELLIEKGYWSAVIENLEKFEGVDHKEIAELIIEKGHFDDVITLASHLKKFEGLDSKIAELLVEKGHWWSVIKNLEKFEELDHKKIAELLIEKGYWYAVTVNLEKFEGVDHKEIAELIIEKVHSDVSALASNLEKLEPLDSKIAKLLTEKGYWSVVINNLKKFEKLDSETVELLIKEVREAE